MAVEKQYIVRQQQRHDIETNWKKAVNFIPKAAEIIVYDPDENYTISRFKIGDGKRKVNELPFVSNAEEIAALQEQLQKELATERARVDSIVASKSIKASVLDYGAKGDGSTDDTTAFTNALAENRTVFVPGGTYNFSGTIIVGENCELELSQDTVLNYTEASGNCIQLEMSSSIRGNHAIVRVPYAFTGNVLYASTSTTDSVLDPPPFKKWDPSWKSGRYVTDLCIVKADSRGFHYSVNGDCCGTAVYIHTNGDKGGNAYASTNMWGLDFSGLRIAGAFTYGVHVLNENEGYTNDMRINAFIDACEVGVCVEGKACAYISGSIQPRRNFTSDSVYGTYAKHGVKLINSKHADLSDLRIWDWTATYTLWSANGEYQHIAMIGDCTGLIVNDFLYYEGGKTDIRDLFYTDTESNLDTMVVLQEPFTRWFKPKESVPYFFDGSNERQIALKEDFDAYFETEVVSNVANALETATDENGEVIGLKSGGYYNVTNGNVTFTTASYYSYTGFIPCIFPEGTTTKVIYAKNLSIENGYDDGTRIVLYDENYNGLVHVTRTNLLPGTSYYTPYEALEDGFKITLSKPSTVKYVRFCFHVNAIGDNPIISVGQEIKTVQEGFLAETVKVKGNSIILTSDGGKSFTLNVNDDGTLSTKPVEIT